MFGQLTMQEAYELRTRLCHAVCVPLVKIVHLTSDHYDICKPFLDTQQEIYEIHKELCAL